MFGSGVVHWYILQSQWISTMYDGTYTLYVPQAQNTDKENWAHTATVRTAQTAGTLELEMEIKRVEFVYCSVAWALSMSNAAVISIVMYVAFVFSIMIQTLAHN